MNTLGMKIIQARREIGMKQVELAKGLATSSMISQIEADKAQPSSKLLAQISERLQKPVRYFPAELDAAHEQNGLLRQVKLMMEQTRYEDASNKLKTALQQGCSKEFYLIAIRLVECLIESKQYERVSDWCLNLYSKALQNAAPYICALALNKLGVSYFQQDSYMLSKYYWDKAKKYSLNPEVPLQLEAQISINLGIVTFRTGSFDESEYHYSRAYEMLHDTDLKKPLADSCLGLSLVCDRYSNYPLAVHYIKQAIDLYVSLRDKESITDSKMNLAIYLYNNKQYNDAITLLLQLMEENEHKEYVLLELARNYYSKSKSESSPERKTTTLAMAEETCFSLLEQCELGTAMQGSVYALLGDIYQMKNDSPESERYYKKAIQMFNIYGPIPLLLDVCTSLATMYINLEQYCLAANTYIQMERSIRYLRTIS